MTLTATSVKCTIFEADIWDSCDSVYLELKI